MRQHPLPRIRRTREASCLFLRNLPHALRISDAYLG
jgi:hypothetical protein